MKDDIHDQMNDMMRSYNWRGHPELEGYSPYEMQQLLWDPFGPHSPVQLQTLKPSECEEIPFFNQIRFILNRIAEEGTVKLTAKGFFPVRFVTDVYAQGYIKDRYIESGIIRLRKETDSMVINLSRILIELAGLAKKRYGKLSLTKMGEKLLSDPDGLLKVIFTTFCRKFQWAYCDRYEDPEIGQTGFAYSLVLLSKYGDEKRLDEFYAEKYFVAFPRFREEITEPPYGTIEIYTSDCYSLRTFDRFLDLFGLIRIEREGTDQGSIKWIYKTDLFDKLIKIRPHEASYESTNTVIHA